MVMNHCNCANLLHLTTNNTVFHEKKVAAAKLHVFSVQPHPGPAPSQHAGMRVHVLAFLMHGVLLHYSSNICLPSRHYTMLCMLHVSPLNCTRYMVLLPGLAHCTAVLYCLYCTACGLLWRNWSYDSPHLSKDATSGGFHHDICNCFAVRSRCTTCTLCLTSLTS